ncbi:MAG: HlyC/CorC family transporter [Alphaproteobacteria bacterium]|nr:HlyC/CorC family transporter [Alphaproteobacteria bacterium]
MADLPRTGKIGERGDRSDSGSAKRSFGGWLRALVPGRNGEGTVREVIEELIEDVDDDSTQIGADQGALIVNILKLHELTAKDVMVPRADIVAADIDSSLDELVNVMAKDAHSRLPVYREQLDSIAGFVHIKDVLVAVRNARAVAVKDIVRDILFAAPSIRVLDLLLEMRARRTHMAIVVDEFGGVDGLVTIEDLVEEIVGEIEDEHDTDGPSMIRRPDGSILADARTEIKELENLIGAFATDEEREEIDTLGGIVFSLIDRVPRRHEIVVHPSGLEFQIVDADSRRVKRLSVRDLRSAGDE